MTTYRPPQDAAVVEAMGRANAEAPRVIESMILHGARGDWKVAEEVLTLYRTDYASQGVNPCWLTDNLLGNTLSRLLQQLGDDWEAVLQQSLLLRATVE